MRLTGSASVTNSRSIATASVTICRMRSAGGGLSSCAKSRHAKSQCRPSSREMSYREGGSVKQGSEKLN